MKNFISFFLFIMLAAAPCQSATPLKFILTDKQSSQTKPTAYCDVTVSRITDNGNGIFDVTVELKNNQAEELLYLFGRSFMEKELKKSRPVSIRFYKYGFSGKKGYRNVGSCDYLDSQIIKIEPEDSRLIIQSLSVNANDTMTTTIPVYLAKKKGKKKVILLDLKDLELTIIVKASIVPDDPTYQRLANSRDSLIDELEGKDGKKGRTFCPHKCHKPSKAQQEKPYRDKIKELVAEADDIIKRERLTDSSERGRGYLQLKESLEDIDLKKYEKICGNDPSNCGCTHNCDYCKLKLDQIYSRMNGYYMKVYNGEPKAKYMNAMDIMYGCCIDNCCKSHKEEWKKGGGIKNKIIEVYNSFKQF